MIIVTKDFLEVPKALCWYFKRNDIILIAYSCFNEDHIIVFSRKLNY